MDPENRPLARNQRNRRAMTKKLKPVEALEITTFKIGKYSCEEFIKANQSIDTWLQRQPGFKSRHIAQQDDGTMVDMLRWDSVAHGTKAMHKIMHETSDSSVHDMIDHTTVSWSCIPVYHRLE
jgi:heme-degrading monooxygenase HmoA